LVALRYCPETKLAIPKWREQCQDNIATALALRPRLLEWAAECYGSTCCALLLCYDVGRLCSRDAMYWKSLAWEPKRGTMPSDTSRTAQRSKKTSRHSMNQSSHDRSFPHATMTPQGSVKHDTTRSLHVPPPTEHVHPPQTIGDKVSITSTNKTTEDIVPTDVPLRQQLREALATCSSQSPETIATHQPTTPTSASATTASNEEKIEEGGGKGRRIITSGIVKILVVVINFLILAAITSAVYRALGRS